MRLKILTISLLLLSLSACTLPWSPPEEMQPNAIPPASKEPITFDRIGGAYEFIGQVIYLDNNGPVIFSATSGGRDHLVIGGIDDQPTYEKITDLVSYGDSYAFMYFEKGNWFVSRDGKKFGPFRDNQNSQRPNIAVSPKDPKRLIILDYHFQKGETLPAHKGDIVPAAVIFDGVTRVPYTNEVYEEWQINGSYNEPSYSVSGTSTFKINNKVAMVSNDPGFEGFGVFYDGHPILAPNVKGVPTLAFASWGRFYDINGKLYFVACSMDYDYSTYCNNDYGLYREPPVIE